MSTEPKKKGGIIRPGQKTPYRKATNEEIERRIEYCAQLLLNQKTKTEIHAIMKRRYGLKYLIVDLLYIKRAQKWLRDRAGMSVDQARNLGVNVCLQIIASGNKREQLMAESRLAEIMGYNAPRRAEVTGAGGGPIAIKDETEDLLREMPKGEVLALLEQTRLQLTIKGNGHTDEP
jgi:hypothetical protein